MSTSSLLISKAKNLMATEQTVPPKIGITTAIAILVALIVLITIALKGERMPTPASADADATVFSEARAMSQLQKIAARRECELGKLQV